ncbi:MAG: thioredoxin family protein [Thermoplasmatota archaeon]
MSTNNEGIEELTGDKFDEYLKANRVTVVDFWAPWCMPCRMQGRFLEKTLKKLPAGGKLAKINVDIYPDIANRYRITGIPQLYLFVDGKITEGWTGLTRPEVIYREMEKHI